MKGKEKVSSCSQFLFSSDEHGEELFWNKDFSKL